MCIVLVTWFWDLQAAYKVMGQIDVGTNKEWIEVWIRKVFNLVFLQDGKSFGVVVEMAKMDFGKN